MLLQINIFLRDSNQSQALDRKSFYAKGCSKGKNMPHKSQVKLECIHWKLKAMMSKSEKTKKIFKLFRVSLQECTSLFQLNFRQEFSVHFLQDANAVLIGDKQRKKGLISFKKGPGLLF